MYRILRWLLGLALGFYFRRIETFHAERVPREGPVLFVSNHPNSLTDSFVIGASVPRKVHFVATVQLFRIAPLKWLLTRCGVIPINRVKDDPRAMRTIAETFEACFQVLGKGQAIGIFPEGITYDDSQLKEVKSGAARIALEFEQRSPGKLRLVPVGLTYSAKEMYRSDVLANFGEPLLAADFAGNYAGAKKDCIRTLTAELERRLQGLIVHLPQLEHERVVAGVKRLYFDRPVLGARILLPGSSNTAADQMALTKRIAEGVEYAYRTDPERAAAFASNLRAYETWLSRLQLTDEYLALVPHKNTLAAQTFLWTSIAILGAPIALYGWAHRAVPFAVVKWCMREFPEPQKRKAQASTTAIASGVVAFAVFYALCIAVFRATFGWPATLYYALSLPPASLVAHYYLREVRKLIASVRSAVVLLRAPSAAKALAAKRQVLVNQIEDWLGNHRTLEAPIVAN
ncbi:MAG TPA: lysophospholipid acyltransferase family protein [Candidatus Dormibacteraeota bacterium]|nr:lysophospholipid acyltransferase family protein [Candidatus Dormibacteraeota bacterium]